MFHAGLRKIFAINSYLKKSLLSELDVDAPTQLTGDNGIGKTTLLRLIPIFYGAEGRLVSRKSNVNQSFVDFYLPRADSYIIFEFATARNEIAHVILYRHPTNGSISYRFVKDSFDTALLIKADTDGKARAIPSTQLVDALQENNRSFEALVTSVKKYRSIIQHVNPASFESHYLAYSLCSGRNDIRHIEKITASLIQGSFSMKDAKHLFMEILDREDGDLKFGLEAMQVERWCNDYKGLSEFLAKKEMFAKAVSNNKVINTIAGQLCKVISVLGEESKVKSAELTDVKSALIALATSRDEALEEVSSKLLELSGSVARLNGDAKVLRVTIDQDEEQLLTYEDACMAELSVQLDHLPIKINQLEENLARHADLQKEVKNVEQQHDLDANTAKTKFSSQSQTIKDKISASRLDEQQSLNAISEVLRKERNTLIGVFNTSEKALTEKVSEDTTALAVLEQQLKTVSAPSQLLDDRVKLDIAVRRHKDEVSQGNIDLMKEKSKQKDAHQKREIALLEIKSNTDSLTTALAQLEAVQKRLDPSNGSLYSYLEEYYPNWQLKPIGKVLSEEVLMNDSLSPTIDAAGGLTLFGLDIDTSNLPANKVTNDADLSLLDSLVLEVDSLESKNKDLTKQVMDYAAELNQIEVVIESLNTAIEVAAEALEQAQDNLENKIVAITREKEKARENLNREIKATRCRLSDISEQVNALRDEHMDSLANAENAALEQRSNVSTSSGVLIEALETELTDIEERYNHTLAALRLEMEQRLSKQGISRDVYNKYEQLTTQLEQDINRIKSREHEILQYREWLVRYNKLQPERRSELALLDASISDLNGKVSGLNRDKVKIETDARAKRVELESRKVVLVTEIDKINSTNQRLLQNSELEATRHEDSEEFDGDVLSLINRTDSMLITYVDRKKVRTRDVRELEEITRNWGEGELLALWRETSSQRSNNTDSSHIDVLDEIITSIIPQITAMTIASAANMGSMLVNFKDALLDFEREIKKLGRSISDQVRQNNNFTVVESIDINVASSLSRISGWGEINDFAAVYGEWDRRGATSLPPTEFYAALKLVATHITEEKLRSPAELFDIKFDVIENGKRKIATTDQDMKVLSSNGTNLLIQAMLYVAMLSNQRGSSYLSITFPTDEIGKLTAENQAVLMQLLEANNFKIVAALPDPKGQTMGLFKNLYHVTDKGILTNKQNPSKLELAKEKRRLERLEQAETEK